MNEKLIDISFDIWLELSDSFYVSDDITEEELEEFRKEKKDEFINFIKQQTKRYTDYELSIRL